MKQILIAGLLLIGMSAFSQPFTGPKSSWHGFDRYDFILNDSTLQLTAIQATPEEGDGAKAPAAGTRRCIVVVPKQAAAGNPWSWRGCYWDHAPQAEIELLKRGFHIAYITTDPGETWDVWYSFLTKEHGLSPKPAFIGMSRGGANAFTWGTAHPDRVSAICADNPGLSQSSLMKMDLLAQNDVPILNICGSIDPILSNTYAIQGVYHASGGRMSVLIKDGPAHHPHSLRNPNVIADFIEQSFNKKDSEKPNFVPQTYRKTAFYSIQAKYGYSPDETLWTTAWGPYFTGSFDKYSFQLPRIEGATTVIVPKQAAAGNPWILRCDQPDGNSAVDLELLGRGYHIVVAPVPYNADGPHFDQWNIVYNYLTDKGFAKKAVAAGRSAATGEMYAWAIENPEKVSCIYGENPILRSSLAKTQPIDHLAPLAKANIPIIHACGADDPHLKTQSEEVRKRYKGKFTLITDKGRGHYPLSPANPQKVADLINASVVVASSGHVQKENASFTPQPANGRYDSYKGLVMAGYQGWFSCPDDGSDRGWYHYCGRDGLFKPGICTIDMWPDVSEYQKIYKTAFSFADGSPAYVMSEYDESTVETHFRWMREYGIDGVFVQRFVSEIKRPKSYVQLNKVWHSAINAANANGRAVSVMYDLSGMVPGDEKFVLDDIDAISAKYDIKERKNNPSYLHHNGKPLVAVWGVGFNDRRRYGFKEAESIINALKERGFSILIGVPTYWREFGNDTMNDAELHRLVKNCDIVMPWFVGRYREETFAPFEKLVKDDIAWCRENKVDYAPLAFPGFSWINMKADSKPIPRNRGSFYWRQLSSHIANGAEMLYLAMFDEIDEGTAIFKCATKVPVGESYFLPLDEDLGNDYYLFLAGTAAKMLKKEIPVTNKIPER